MAHQRVNHGWRSKIAATGGRPTFHKGILSDLSELYTKVKDAYEHGKLDDVANQDMGLVASSFGEAFNGKPGNREASRLVASRLDIDVYVFLGLCANTERVRPNMGVRPKTCRARHLHNWNLPDLPKIGIDTVPSCRVKRKYGETVQT